MNAGSDSGGRRRKREGWPWTSGAPSEVGLTPQGSEAKKDPEAAVIAEAQEVSRLARELVLAVSRLEEAQLEAEVASDRLAFEHAAIAIDRARRIAS